MRKNKIKQQPTEFSILALDDDKIITLTLQSYFQAAGYHVDIENDPAKAIERVRETHYDILLLDFLMEPFCGDKVVSEIREFDKDLYIILLTGHKSMAPPIKTMRELDIQGYFEKSDRFDQLELLVESCVKSIRHMRTIQRYKDGLNKIVEDIPSLYQIQSEVGLLDTVLLQTSDFLQSDDALLYCETDVDAIQPENAGCLFEGRGRYTNSDMALAQKYLEEIRSRKRSAQFSPIIKDGRLALPLFDKNKVFGVICSDISDNSADTIRLFELYAKQAGSAISNLLLHSLLSKKNNDLKDAYQNLQGNYMEVINIIRSLVDARDIYTRGHSDRVAHYSTLVAKAMHKNEDYLERVNVAGIFHDIGKMGTADEILFKCTKLSDSEFEVIKQHPGKGSQILSAVKFFGDIAPIVEAHHERYDGAGYPNKAAGEDIPEEARIICVADSFDAMTSNRHYRSSMTPEEALDEIQRCRKTQFDPNITDVFLDVFHDNFDTIQQSIEWTYGPASLPGQKEDV